MILKTSLLLKEMIGLNKAKVRGHPIVVVEHLEHSDRIVDGIEQPAILLLVCAQRGFGANSQSLLGKRAVNFLSQFNFAGLLFDASTVHC